MRKCGNLIVRNLFSHRFPPCMRASSTFLFLPPLHPLCHCSSLSSECVFTCLLVPEVCLMCFQAIYMFFTPFFEWFSSFLGAFWVFEGYVLSFFIFLAHPHVLQSFCPLSYLDWTYSCLWSGWTRFSIPTECVFTCLYVSLGV